MNRLDRAIADFEDETLDLTMGERITNLRTALTWAAYERIKRIHKVGRKSEEGKDLDFKQVETQKQFGLIVKMYNDQLKQNRALGKAQDDGMDKDFLRRVKEQKSSIGEIVRDLKPSDN